MIGSLNLKLDYYNAKLALWEPIIEPKAETRKQKVMEKKWDLTVTLQQNASSDFGSGKQRSAFSLHFIGRILILSHISRKNEKKKPR